MAETRTLAGLLAALPGAGLIRGTADCPITSIEHDSRLVRAGSLFVAIPGFNTDGHGYVAQAAAAGAAAVIVRADRSEGIPALDGVSVVAVDDTRCALSRAAAWFRGYPSRELTVIGVTGTDGKTTTSHLLTSVLEAAGFAVGRVGTVDVYLPGERGAVNNRMSTPEANEVQALLRRMADAGCEVAIVESTSHGLALRRLDDVDYDVAVFTNITGDHLDFHRTFEAYRDAKAMLFAALGRSWDKGIEKAAVVNDDDPSASYMLARAPGARHWRFGLESRDADVMARNVHLRPDGSSFRLITPAGPIETGVSLPALFNVANALAAATAALALGVPLQAIARGLESAPGVPGRMERIDARQPFEVVVDYAHTGDAVRKVLEVLRQLTRGRLIIVVGAAGERDPGRRYGVGRAAAEGADFAVFTSEDPRREDPAAIVAEIARHAEAAGRRPGEDFVEVPDRREAIAAALRRARSGDVVVICGKGHEQSMIFGTEAVPWDDRDVARQELAKLGFVAG
jgi:UDP-N-acetylmuramoyl-L-alanyl-D-glutamate--2,6-diaminopimelate ligase